MKVLLDILGDLWGYIKDTRKIYISLLIAFLLLIGGVIILAEGSAVMPFIYTLF
jgi:hypothetical protein